MDVEPAEQDVVRRRRVVQVAAVVAVDSVLGGAGDLQIVEHQVLHAGEVHPFAAPVDDGLRLPLEPADPDRCLCSPGDAGYPKRAGVGPRMEPDGGAGRYALEGAGQRAEGVLRGAVTGVVVTDGGDMAFGRRLLPLVEEGGESAVRCRRGGLGRRWRGRHARIAGHHRRRAATRPAGEQRQGQAEGQDDAHTPGLRKSLLECDTCLARGSGHPNVP